MKLLRDQDRYGNIEMTVKPIYLWAYYVLPNCLNLIAMIFVIRALSISNTSYHRSEIMNMFIIAAVFGGIGLTMSFLMQGRFRQRIQICNNGIVGLYMVSALGLNSFYAFYYEIANIRAEGADIFIEKTDGSTVRFQAIGNAQSIVDMIRQRMGGAYSQYPQDPQYPQNPQYPQDSKYPRN